MHTTKPTLLTPFVLTLFLFAIAVFSFGQKTEKAVTYFDYAKHELTPEAKETLNALLEKVKTKKIISIRVSGHADADGNDTYNRDLSRERSASIQKYLVSKGVPGNKIKLESFGEGQPKVSNQSERKKRKNRRAEIVIRYTNADDESTEEETFTIAETPATDEPEQAFAVNRENIQTYKFSAKRDATIKGRQGTVIKIPKSAFVNNKGITKKGRITLELIEVYTDADKSANNITTLSNQKALETAGIIYVRTVSRKKELALKRDFYYTIEFPAEKKKKGMNLFYGDASAEQLNWLQSPRNFVSGTTQAENQYETGKYIFNATETGWIGCARFANQAEKVEP